MASIRGWFEERVRPLVGFGDEGDWQAVDDTLDEPALDTVVERVHERDGSPPRAALTMLAGWTAGYVAGVIAIGVMRDGVLVRAARPGVLRVLRHPDGWYGDARLGAEHVAVAAEHPWAGRSEVVPELAAAAVDEIARACDPIVEAIARRSGRGRRGLWAQVAEGVADAAPSLAPALGPERAIQAAQDLLSAPGAPWRHMPRLWIADGMVVKHRRSCCLYYRHEPTAPEPDYCDACVFRAPADVEARALAQR
jgi:hypothetical protein